MPDKVNFFIWFILIDIALVVFPALIELLPDLTEIAKFKTQLYGI